MKILFINFQSGMHMSYGYMQYITSGWKYIFPHNSDALDKAIGFINKEQPDIVAFAEIDDCSWRTKQCNHVQTLAMKTHLKYFHFFPTRVSGKWIVQGNAILSRHPIVETGQVQLPGRGEKRYLCNANIDINSTVLHFFTTHLSTTKKRNEKQRQFIADTMKKINTPAILTGDFNIGAQEMKIIQNQTHLIDVKFDATFPSWKPKIILDHMFVSEELDIQKITTYTKEKFSDHLPIGISCNML